MAYSAFDCNGSTIRSPSTRQMRALLASLVADDPDACVALVHEGQWTMSAYHSGRICLENAGTGEGPWHQDGVPVTRILELWQMLAEGRIDELRRLPWAPGSGG